MWGYPLHMASLMGTERTKGDLFDPTARAARMGIGNRRTDQGNVGPHPFLASMPPPPAPRRDRCGPLFDYMGNPIMDSDDDHNSRASKRHDDRSRHSSLGQGDRQSPERSRREGSAKRSNTRSSFVDEEENLFLPKGGTRDGRNSVAPSHHSSATGGMSDRTRQRRRAEKQPENRSGPNEPLARDPDEAISAWIQNNLPATTDEMAMAAAARAAHLQTMHKRPLSPKTIQDILMQVRAEHAARNYVHQRAAQQEASQTIPRTYAPIVGRAVTFGDRVILQKWYNAAAKAREPTAVADQGIDFDSEGNPWERAPQDDARGDGRQRHVGETTQRCGNTRDTRDYDRDNHAHPTGGVANQGGHSGGERNNGDRGGGNSPPRGPPPLDPSELDPNDEARRNQRRHRTPQERLNSRRPTGYERTYAPPPATGRHIAEGDGAPPDGSSSSSESDQRNGGRRGDGDHNRDHDRRGQPDRGAVHPRRHVDFNDERSLTRNERGGPRLSRRDMGMASAVDQPDLSEYSRAIRQRYADMVHKRLGAPFELPPGVKPPSHVQKPEKWSGDQDVDKFNRWLHSLMRWLRINQYSVPAREEECITLIGLHLDGEAAVWFDEEVEDADDERQWTFLRVVIGLYDRFVQPTAIQDATEEFLATEYSPTTGVRGFYDALERTAKRMIHPPDHYMFRRQFVVGLPGFIRDKMVDRGYNAERHPISDLYAVALQAEESRIMAKHYTHAATANKARNHPGTGTATAKVDKPAIQVGSRPSNRVHNSKGYAFGLRRPPTDDRAVNAPAQAPLPKTTTATLSKPHPPSQPRVMNRNPPGRTGGGQFDATKAKCYACGNFGHISTDPKCPKYGQPRLNAARVENGSEGDTACEPHNEDVEDALPEDFPAAGDEGNLDGSQYSSPDDDNGYDCYYDVAEDNVHMGVMDTTYNPEGVQLFSVRALDPPAGGDSAAIGETTRISAMRPKYQPSGQPMERPKRAHIITKSIAQYVVINGVRAYTLFDSGCTTDCMSPDFARVAKVKYGYLKDVVPLQLGTVGSSASIQFGTYSRVLFGGIDSREYFDVANIDRYDVILGTPWMHKHGISLDFVNRVICIGDQAHPSLTEGEESVEMARRHAIRKKE
ncbi:hypothetical protein EYR40_006405 [Pleurotus pulmonarius]|nr:hypothetical protein EYR40_006405 [Pleurotus pulmonarius]